MKYQKELEALLAPKSPQHHPAAAARQDLAVKLFTARMLAVIADVLTSRVWPKLLVVNPGGTYDEASFMQLLEAIQEAMKDGDLEKAMDQLNDVEEAPAEAGEGSGDSTPPAGDVAE